MINAHVNVNKGFIWNPRICECKCDVTQGNIYNKKIANVEKIQLVSQLNKVVKILMKMK